MLWSRAMKGLLHERLDPAAPCVNGDGGGIGLRALRGHSFLLTPSQILLRKFGSALLGGPRRSETCQKVIEPTHQTDSEMPS